VRSGPTFVLHRMMMKLNEEWVQAALSGVSGDVELIAVEEAGDRTRRIVRVFVDTPEGVDHEVCARVSETLGKALDESGYGEGAYTLEVSSPGLERPLKKRHHFEAHVGGEVYVKTIEPVGSTRVWRGELRSVEGDTVVIATGGVEAPIDLSNIAKAHVIFTF